MVDAEDLATKMDDQARRTLEYGRHRFLWTWLCMALLALLIGLALLVSVDTAKNQNETVKMTADTANAKSDANTASNEEITKYLKGEQGIPGVPGANGKNGAPGQPGSVPSDLPPGPIGPKGATGATGSPGVMGEPGLEGPAGVPGPAGNSGVAGEIGAPGEIGPAGAQGPKGEKGEKGDTGLQGPEGISGPTGPQGPPGTSASFNPQFISGFNGPNDISQKAVTVACPSGTKAIGGGFSVPLGVEVTSSKSVVDGWNVTAVATTIAPGTSWTLNGTVVCA